MPKIRITKTQQVIEVFPGANLMRALLEHKIPVASSCGGEGVCQKCWIVIDEKSKVLSCQTPVWEDISVDTSYW